MFLSTFGHLVPRLSRHGCPSNRLKRPTSRLFMQQRPRSWLHLEALEGRCLPSTVTNLNDNGAGSLRQAIIDTPSGGTVDFQPDLTGTITLATGELAIAKNLTIDGPGRDIITVSGNHAHRVFTINSPFFVTISGLTIADGSVGSSAGGGINNAGVLAITDCTVKDNVVGGSNNGGGIFNANTGTLSVTSSILSGNSASGNGHGGGIFNSGTLTVTSSTLSGNHISGNLGSGGGIANDFSGRLTVTSSTLSGNSVTGNGGGGGINNNSNGTVTVTHSSFSGNTDQANGGGINSNGGTVTIATSTFSMNSAVRGGAISHTANSTLTVTSSTLSGNSASIQGGGIYHTGSGRVVPRNDIVANNRGPTSSDDVSGALASQGYNLIGNGTGGSGYDDGSDLVGTSDMPIDPVLGSLAEHGGPTETMDLLLGSPALNAGDPNELGTPDQRGVVRSGGVNIGAYQASATAYHLAARDTVQAGTPFDVTATAVDPYDQVAVGYTGTATFSSADPYGASLPGDSTFTADDGGVVTFAAGVTLYTAGVWDVTATDLESGITGSVSVVVTPAAAVQLTVDAPAQAASGTPFDVTITAVDPYGNTDTNYQGTVTFCTTDLDPGVVLPADYTFTLDDRGSHTFTDTGLGETTLITLGDETFTATDTADDTVTGSATITVGWTAPGTGTHRLDQPPQPGRWQGSAAQTSVPPHQQMVAVDRLFASVNKGGARFASSELIHHAHAEADSWSLDALGGVEALFS